MFNYQYEWLSHLTYTIANSSMSAKLVDFIGLANITQDMTYPEWPPFRRFWLFMCHFVNEWREQYNESYNRIQPQIEAWISNVMLHYGAGVSIGLMAGVIFLLFVLTKFLPSKLKSLGYLMVAFGGSVTLWMLSSVTYLFSDPVVDTVINYWQYILAYCILTGIVSFAIVYRMGGVTDERSLNLIQWLLQVIGLILIYNSTQIRDVSIVLVVITVSAYNFPRALFSHSFGKKYWNRFFPPKIKLLTEDEYITQGNIETKKALEELRDYCQSPECQSWKIISKLKTPQRFAEFVEGSSWHVTNEELLEYDSETDMIPPHESMDQGEDNEDNESEMDFILSSP